MRFAIDVAPLGELADPRIVVRLARAAEAAGWDGISTWDNIGNSMGAPFAEIFVNLAAVAASTERLRLITSALVLPRRRPQLVAQAAGTLDRLSGGRLTIGVAGGGDPPEYEAFGEDPDPSVHARLLDEALEIVDGLLRGETVRHEGPAFVVRGAAVGPRPVQEPRPPIWVGGTRPGALRRAARWDGWIGLAAAGDGSISMDVSPEAIGESVARIHEERSVLGRSDSPFDVAVLGYSDAGAPDVPATYAVNGATWWLESLHGMRGSVDDLIARIEAGPAR